MVRGDGKGRRQEGQVMRLGEMVPLLKGMLVSEQADLDLEVSRVAAADLMSDVLAFADPGAVLVTGLVNPQVVITADMADIVGIVFVRGKMPPPETVAVAREERIPLIMTSYTMFEACGLLYQAGLKAVSMES